jgi:hypothetical protein
MKDIRHILATTDIVHEVAMVQSTRDINLYFILRDEINEVIVYDFLEFVKTNLKLTPQEIKHIKKEYPDIKINGYIIDYELKEKVLRKLTPNRKNENN